MTEMSDFHTFASLVETLDEEDLDGCSIDLAVYDRDGVLIGRIVSASESDADEDGGLRTRLIVDFSDPGDRHPSAHVPAKGEGRYITGGC